MPYRQAVGLALLTLAAVHPYADAQDTARVAAVRTIRLGQYVRADVARLGRVEGQFVTATATTVTLTSHGVTAEVPLLELERLWVRQRATGRGALIGAGLGVLVGIVGGLIISSVACEPVDGGDCTAAEVAALTGLLGGAGGGFIGAGVGFVIPVWRLRFP
jgi:hypothetical protein